MIVLRNVREVAKAFGDGQKLADLTGTSRFAVHNWIKRDQIPGHHYAAIQEATRALGLCVPDELFARVLVHPRDIKDSHDHPVSEESGA
jgi:hypothetical protein